MLSLKKYLKIHEKAPVPLLIGIGIGILITYPLVMTHPIRWGGAFLIVGMALHIKSMKL